MGPSHGLPPSRHCPRPCPWSNRPPPPTHTPHSHVATGTGVTQVHLPYVQPEWLTCPAPAQASTATAAWVPAPRGGARPSQAQGCPHSAQDESRVSWGKGQSGGPAVRFPRQTPHPRGWARPRGAQCLLEAVLAVSGCRLVGFLSLLKPLLVLPLEGACPPRQMATCWSERLCQLLAQT